MEDKNRNELHTRQKYDMIQKDTGPNLKYTAKPHARDDISGSDGTVDPITGDRAFSSAVHFKKIRYLMKQRYIATDDATSYRAELEGIHGTLLLAKMLRAYGLKQICDNQEAVNKIKETSTPNDMTAPEADVILACKNLISA